MGDAFQTPGLSSGQGFSFAGRRISRRVAAGGIGDTRPGPPSPRPRFPRFPRAHRSRRAPRALRASRDSSASPFPATRVAQGRLPSALGLPRATAAGVCSSCLGRISRVACGVGTLIMRNRALDADLAGRPRTPRGGATRKDKVIFRPRDVAHGPRNLASFRRRAQHYRANSASALVLMRGQTCSPVTNATRRPDAKRAHRNSRDAAQNSSVTR